MRTIVVVYSKFLAKRFFSRLPREAIQKERYLSFPTSSSDLVDLHERCGFKPISEPSISPSQKEHFLQDYLKFIDKLAEVNGRNLFWWATDLASKNRFTSPLGELLGAFAQCTDAVQKFGKHEGMLTIIQPPWPVACALQDVAQESGWDLEIVSWPWSRCLARWRNKAGALIEFVRGFSGAIFRIWEARRHFGKTFFKRIRDKPVYLIKSFVYLSSFTGDGRYHDPFFGGLSKFLSERQNADTDILTVTTGFEKRGECLKRMSRVTENLVVPLEAFLSWPDVFRSLKELLWGHFTKPFRIPDRTSFLNYKVGALLNECVASSGWKIPFYQYLHLAAGLRIAQVCKLKACTLTFEANPWERMFIAGLRHYYPDLPIFGYQHSVVPQAAAGVFIRPAEKENCPLPSNILTTGRVPAQIMRQYGVLSPDYIQPACALRYQYLRNIDYQQKNQGNNEFIVLVALEGVWEVLPLLEYVLDQAPKHPNVFFCIRSHPVLPLPKLLNRLGRKLDPGGSVVASRAGTVASDVENCSAVLYWGTTVALEALMMGKPLIHFDRGDFLSYDPLFEFEDFKWTVRNDQDLQTALKEIRNLSDERQSVLKKRGRNYISSYFYEVNEKSMCKFLPES